MFHCLNSDAMSLERIIWHAENIVRAVLCDFFRVFLQVIACFLSECKK